MLQQRCLRAYDSLRCFLTPNISAQALAARPLKSSQGLYLRPCRAFAATVAISAEKPARVKQSPKDNDSDAQKSNMDDTIAQETEKQQRAPWHREGSNLPPVARQRSAGAMTKGMRFAISLRRYTNFCRRQIIDNAFAVVEANNTPHDHRPKF